MPQYKIRPFDRQSFEVVKAKQKLGWNKYRISHHVNYGTETVRKAMKAVNWSQYRKDEIAARKRRKEREEQRKADDAGIFSTQAGDLLFDAEEERQLSYHPSQIRKQQLYRTGAAVVIVALVLFCLVR